MHARTHRSTLFNSVLVGRIAHIMYTICGIAFNIAYFLADTAHPDRFVFFSIGQYGIPAGNGHVWQQTLRFLDQ